MPQYQFVNDKTSEIKTLFFHMRDEKKHVDESGTEWKRIYSNPQASIDSKIDVFSEAAFVEKTKKAGNLGELFDRARDAHLERASKRDGKDEIRESYLKKAAADRGGKHIIDQTK